MTKLFVHSIALELETAFSRFGLAQEATADDFEIRPQAAFEAGLARLVALGKISDQDFSDYIRDYDFNDRNLASYLETPNGEENVRELIRRMKALN